ncbi:MAG: hypothetical protein WAT19_05090 [Ferruginibacter sp.]
MNFLPNQLYHIYNQGNNRQIVFRDAEDYLAFLRLTRKYIVIHADVVAWCLLPNHFHLLLFTQEKSCVMVQQGGIKIEKLTNGIRKLLSSYARIFNKRYAQTGSVFRQKTKAKNMSSPEAVLQNIYTWQEYSSNCFRYIHQDPVAAGLVKHALQWAYSSYADYAGLRSGSLCNKHIAERLCGYDVRDFQAEMERLIPEDIRKEFEQMPGTKNEN